MDRKPSRIRPEEIAFLSAVKSGDLGAIRGFVALKTREKEGEEEEDGGDENRIRSLMSAQNEAGETALIISADNNLIDVLKFLAIFYDLPTASIKSRTGVDALFVAAKNGHTVGKQLGLGGLVK